MALSTVITNFITDAKARVVSLTNEMQSLSKRDSAWHGKYDDRKMLLWMMELVEPVDAPASGSHYLTAAGWTDAEIENEIMYWRGITGINTTLTLTYKTY